MAELNDKDLQQVAGGAPSEQTKYVTAGAGGNPFNGCPDLNSAPSLPATELNPFIIDNVNDLDKLANITNGTTYDGKNKTVDLNF